MADSFSSVPAGFAELSAAQTPTSTDELRALARDFRRHHAQVPAHSIHIVATPADSSQLDIPVPTDLFGDVDAVLPFENLNVREGSAIVFVDAIFHFLGRGGLLDATGNCHSFLFALRGPRDDVPAETFLRLAAKAGSLLTCDWMKTLHIQGVESSSANWCAAILRLAMSKDSPLYDQRFLGTMLEKYPIIFNPFAASAWSIDVLLSLPDSQPQSNEAEPQDNRNASAPSWNKTRGELSFEGNLAKKVRNIGAAKNVVLILDTFQELKWPEKIDDPLPGGADGKRLRDAIESLNKGLIGIRFRPDGTGMGITWERA